MDSDKGWLLALDLSAPAGVIVLDGPGGLFGHAVEAGSRVSRLFVAAEALAACARITPQDIALVGVAGGPGSFTGVRVAVMAAKTLACALRVPLVAPGSLETAAAAARGARDAVLAVMDARRGEVYHALYRLDDGDPVALRGPAVAAPREVLASLEEWMDTAQGSVGILGTGVDAFPGVWPRDLLLEGLALPDAVAMARLCRTRWERGETVDPLELMPLYVRHPDARERFAGGGEAGPCN